MPKSSRSLLQAREAGREKSSYHQKLFFLNDMSDRAALMNSHSAFVNLGSLSGQPYLFDAAITDPLKAIPLILMSLQLWAKNSFFAARCAVGKLNLLHQVFHGFICRRKTIFEYVSQMIDKGIDPDMHIAMLIW